MSWLLFSDSSTSVEIFPARSWKESIKKDQSEYRAASGKRYAYTWGTHRTWSFPMEFVSSADASQISSWWYSDAKLLLKEDSDAQVFSVQLVGANQPLTEFIRPHRDQLRGTIVLETY